MEEVVILKSKKKIYLAILVSIFLIVAGVTLFCVADSSKIPIILSLLALIIIFIGGSGIFFFIKNLRGSQVGLVINEIGINDTSKATSLGLIKWEEITDIESINIEGTLFILIHVKEPERFLERTKYLSRRPLKLGIKMYGTPIIISAHSIQYKFDKLEELLQSSFIKYKRN